MFSFIGATEQAAKHADVQVFFLSKEMIASQETIAAIPGLSALVEAEVFTGAFNQAEMFPAIGSEANGAAWTIVAGVGDEPVAAEDWKEAAARAVRTALQKKQTQLIVHILTSNQTTVQEAEAIKAISEGFLLADYKRKSYQLKQDDRSTLAAVSYQLKHAHDAGLAAAVSDIQITALATHYARDLINTPGNRLVPQQIAEAAIALAEQYGFECTVLDEQQLMEQGMQGLYSVGKGSVNPPRMIALKYAGQSEWVDVLGLVGKGMTFDTGGISLKTAAGMEEMISDMSGAAAVLGTMKAIGQLKPQKNVLAVIAVAENMPSGAAYKPGDVIDTLSGKTIEITNTDAEGRVILADAITYAKQLGASRLIDLATLTGAVIICLGDVATGAVTNDDAFLAELIEVSRRTGEHIWQLPVYKEYREYIKSKVADVRNSTGKRDASSITAGLFIGEFAEDTPWIHLDIAGTAWLSSDRGVHAAGGTGVMVRTLTAYICEYTRSDIGGNND